MIDLRPEHLETVKRILAAHVPECEVRAFGSRVTWTAKDYSDLDLVVVGQERLDPQCLGRLTEALESSDLPIRVDVLDWHALSEKFRKVIEKQFEVVQKGEKGSRELAGGSMTECTVGEIAAPIRNALVGGPFGSDLVSNDYVPMGVPVIRGTNMGHGRWVGGEFAYVTPEKADSLSANCAKAGDLVFTQRGTLGQVALVPKKGADRYLISQSQMKLTVDAEKADALFLYYVFTSAEQQDYIHQSAIQTGVPHTNLGILRNTPLTLPPLAEQKAIAGVLAALDDKIESNRRTSQALERVARAIFRAWFVEFEPVKAKAAGARSFPGMPQDAFDALPNRFVESELGPVPEGWLVGKIKDCCTHIQNGGTPRRNEPQFWENGEIPWLTSGEVRQPIITTPDHFITEAGLEESSAKWVSPLSTVIALYGATAGQVSLVSSRLTTNQAVCALIPKKHHAFFNYLCMRNATTGLESKAVGSAQQNISKGIVEETQIILPPVPHLECLTALVRPLFEHWISNLYQSRTLAALRDYLLPKLLRGELRVAGGEGTTS